MKKLFLILSVSILLLQSCKEECPECFTPPAPFVFEMVDNTSGENLFTNGTYEASDIKVTNTADDSPVAFDFISENDLNVIQVKTIGWKTESVNYAVNIASENIFNLKVDAEVVTENCCTFSRYNEVVIENAEYEMDASTGVYLISVE